MMTKKLGLEVCTGHLYRAISYIKDTLKEKGLDKKYEIQEIKTQTTVSI